MQEKWILFCYALIFSSVFFFLAYRQGFFNSFHSSRLPSIRGSEVLFGFVPYLLYQVVLGPILIGLYLFLNNQSLSDFSRLDDFSKGWLSLFLMLVALLSIVPAYFVLPSHKRDELWSQTSTSWYKQVAFGIAAWLLIFPLATAANQLISIVVFYFFQHPEQEQMMIQQMRKIASHPLLFSCLGVTIATIVPLTEEFLFRGLLQNWLKRILNNVTASVAISSVIFSCFHFSFSLGWTNLELLPTLFILSCMLGYIYERQRSLWASVGLHGFYNLVSLISIFAGLE